MSTSKTMKSSQAVKASSRERSFSITIPASIALKIERLCRIADLDFNALRDDIARAAVDYVASLYVEGFASLFRVEERAEAEQIAIALSRETPASTVIVEFGRDDEGSGMKMPAVHACDGKVLFEGTAIEWRKKHSKRGWSAA